MEWLILGEEHANLVEKSGMAGSLLGGVATFFTGGSVVKEIQALEVLGKVANAYGKQRFFNPSKANAVKNEFSLAKSANVKHPLEGLSPANVVRLADELGVQTARDQLLLWSGLGRSNSGIKLSQEFARTHGGMTLEMTKGGKWLDNMDLFGSNSPFTWSEAVNIWTNVSKLTVQQASGQVRAVTGIMNPNAVFRAEMSELLMNKNILGIDEISLRPRYGFN